MSFKLLISCGILPLMLLAGCSTTAERTESDALPDEYAEADAECRDITGRYRAVPQPMGGEEAPTAPLLAQTMLPHGERLSLATEVELMVDDEGALHVEAFDADGALLVKQLHAPQSGIFSCDDGQFQFHPKVLADEPPGIEWETVVIRKTVDGSLMLRKGGLFSGLVFVVAPMVASPGDWYLFKAAPAAQ